ncbi:hypothetical protein [Thalassoglobus polymorphus]|uniref:Uncharacterized protein n=1 Tax=Thalassoglobus polymorphus TaxID=2527994 RepID=A0A517QJK3_9PLAN|nr:hypothetical protein [Thalassoglobus polymorphus]QDT31822.1 hypothetical protein Mal48_10580 [Thalassoglobus polymorphus]
MAVNFKSGREMHQIRFAKLTEHFLLGIAVICAVLGIASAIWAIKIWRRPQEDPEVEDGPSQS